MSKPSFLEKNKIPKEIVITGLVCITLLEMLALFLGHNGTMLKTVLVVIALGIGFTIPTPKGWFK